MEFELLIILDCKAAGSKGDDLSELEDELDAQVAEILQRYPTRSARREALAKLEESVQRPQLFVEAGEDLFASSLFKRFYF